MFVVSRETEYAIFLINFLKDKNEPISLSHISRHSGLSRQFLAKVAGRLKSAKILASKEGARGGYWLRASPDKISLWRIFDLCEGDKRIVSCFKKHSDCVRRCHLRRFWRRLEKDIQRQLKAINLAQIK